jgi:SHS2 domain-containing protein
MAASANEFSAAPLMIFWRVARSVAACPSEAAAGLQALGMSMGKQKVRQGAMNCSASPAPGRPRWEHFAHDADIGVRGWGPTVAEAFEQAACALTAVVTDAQIEPQSTIKVSCEAPDIELLFVEWLNAVIYEMAVRNMLFGRFAVRIAGKHLDGTLRGEPVDIPRHSPACEPKGATYTALKVAQGHDGMWSAACIVDV